MKRLANLIPVWVLFFLAFMGVFALAQDKPDKPVPKPLGLRDRIDQAATRALRKARTSEEQPLLRVSLLLLGNEDCVSAVAEYTSGDIGIFQGTDDAEKDAWILIDRRQLSTLGECCERASKIK